MSISIANVVEIYYKDYYLLGWLITGATAIFCWHGLNQPRPAFEVEYEPLQTPMPELGFEPDTFSPIASALNTWQADGRLVFGKCGTNK